MYEFTAAQKIYLRIKYTADFFIGLLGLMITSPLLAVIALLIWAEDHGPVLFRQKRVGLHGRVFNIYKFRTMCVGAEKMGSGVYSGAGDQRVTRIGRFLRASSLDELPQFLNLIRGECSCIGPRAPLTYHPWPWEGYTGEQRQMFLVRPGITGWAQVNGRKGVEWSHRIELNVWYVKHISFLLDLKIAWMTVFKVFSNADNVNIEPTVVKKSSELTKK